MKFLVLFGIILAFAVFAVSPQADGNYSLDASGVLSNLTQRVQAIRESVLNSSAIRNLLETRNSLNASEIRKQINDIDERIQSAFRNLIHENQNNLNASEIRKQINNIEERIKSGFRNLENNTSGIREYINNAKERIQTDVKILKEAADHIRKQISEKEREEDSEEDQEGLQERIKKAACNMRETLERLQKQIQGEFGSRTRRHLLKNTQKTEKTEEKEEKDSSCDYESSCSDSCDSESSSSDSCDSESSSSDSCDYD